MEESLTKWPWWRRYPSEYILRGMSWKTKFGVFYLRYQHGNSLINILKDFLMIIGIGSVMTGVYFDIPFKFFFLLGVVWIWSCYTLGFLNEKFGFWKEQEKYSSGEINLFFKEMSEKIDNINNNLKK